MGKGWFWPMKPDRLSQHQPRTKSSYSSFVRAVDISRLSWRMYYNTRPTITIYTTTVQTIPYAETQGCTRMHTVRSTNEHWKASMSADAPKSIYDLHRWWCLLYPRCTDNTDSISRLIWQWRVMQWSTFRGICTNKTLISYKNKAYRHNNKHEKA